MDSLRNKILESSFVQILCDEVNQIFLQIDGKWFVICSKNGFESINITLSSDPITLDLELKRMPIITQFEGLTISCINEIENFGVEICFSEFDDKALIVKTKTDGLKIGVANFINKI